MEFCSSAYLTEMPELKQLSRWYQVKGVAESSPLKLELNLQSFKEYIGATVGPEPLERTLWYAHGYHCNVEYNVE